MPACIVVGLLLTGGAEVATAKSTDKSCGFYYNAKAGDTYVSVAAQFADAGVTACDICCASGGGAACVRGRERSGTLIAQGELFGDEGAKCMTDWEYYDVTGKLITKVQGSCTLASAIHPKRNGPAWCPFDHVFMWGTRDVIVHEVIDGDVDECMTDWYLLNYTTGNSTGPIDSSTYGWEGWGLQWCPVPNRYQQPEHLMAGGETKTWGRCDNITGSTLYIPCKHEALEYKDSSCPCIGWGDADVVGGIRSGPVDLVDFTLILEEEWAPAAAPSSDVPSSPSLLSALQPGELIEAEGRLYVFFPWAQTWQQAEDTCKSLQSQDGRKWHLATFDSWEQESTVTSVLPCLSFWIGLRFSPNIAWVDGSRSEYRAWEEGQPDRVSQNQQEDCVYRHQWNADTCNAKNTWHDRPCDAKMSLLCSTLVDGSLADPPAPAVLNPNNTGGVDSPSTTTPPDDSNVGMLAGIIAGVVIGLVLLALMVAFVMYRRRQRASQAKPVEPPSYNESSMASTDRAKLGSSNPQDWKHDLAGNSWVVAPEQLEFLDEIGRGSYGSVYRGNYNEGPVAIKCLHEQAVCDHFALSGTERATRALVREIQLMTMVRSPYIVLFMGVCLQPLSCVTEFCARGSLYDLLKAAKMDKKLARHLSWKKRVNIALSTARGMAHLHKMGIVHRDLKSPNIMIDDNFMAKVGDFGLSAALNSEGAGSTKHVAGASTIKNLNRRWMAPEVASGLLTNELGGKEIFTKAADIWSFGLVLHELMTFNIPFNHMSDAQVFLQASLGTLVLEVPKLEDIVGGQFPSMKAYTDLLMACCSANSQDRPSFKQVVEQLKYLHQGL